MERLSQVIESVIGAGLLGVDYDQFKLGTVSATCLFDACSASGYSPPTRPQLKLLFGLAQSERRQETDAYGYPFS